MTIASAAPRARASAASARMEVAWTVSASALGSKASYSSAVLHFTCRWDASADHDGAEATATVSQAAAAREVPLPEGISVYARRSGEWTHVEVAAGDGERVLSASFEHGRLVYCTAVIPRLAGLRGGTYDSPTGILELYDAP